MSDEIVKKKEYKEFVLSVKNKISCSQQAAFRAVNLELIKLYWEIGQLIVERQEKHGWGKSVVNFLAEELQKEFSGIRGFSASNLWRMQNLYLTYKDNEKLALLVREISWSHNLAILEKCKDENEQTFYMQMTKKFGWSKNILIHNIKDKAYEKFLINQTNFDKTVPEKYQHQASLAVKDEYAFDFLGLSEFHAEKDLEAALVKNIRSFLTEMGGYFAFVGSQYKLSVGGQDYFIDLLLFHRKLQCLVAIELKVGEFKPEYGGKLQFYLSALDDLVRLDNEKPSMGIIVCREKNRTVVEYTLKDVNKPMGVSTYKTTANLPEDIKSLLPSPDEISERLSIFEE